MRLYKEDPINIRCPICNKLYQMVEEIETKNLPKQFRVKCYGCPKLQGRTDPRGPVYKQWLLTKSRVEHLLELQQQPYLARVRPKV